MDVVVGEERWTVRCLRTCTTWTFVTSITEMKTRNKILRSRKREKSDIEAGYQSYTTGLFLIFGGNLDSIFECAEQCSQLYLFIASRG